jgi:hypothetical protein
MMLRRSKKDCWKDSYEITEKYEKSMKERVPGLY